jgi:F-type H+-transporting ATPase subunit gamma
MANLIDIRRRIRSVKNTQQITKAVKMVAASKLRRSQDRAVATRPYASTLEAILRAVTARIASREDGAPLHPLLATRDEKNVVLVVVSGDKGLAGGFNTNVNRAAGAFLREAPGRGIASVGLVALGKKANDFWKRRPVEILQAQAGLAALGAAPAGEIARALAARFVSGETDAVYVISNEFKSAISQVVRTKRLLPIALESAANVANGVGGVDYLYEPSPEEILGTLLPRFLEFQMYRVILESQAAFFAAQMTAMDSATKNAGDMIDSLTLTYNRARQARITKELIEIVSGAAALE